MRAKVQSCTHHPNFARSARRRKSQFACATYVDSNLLPSGEGGRRPEERGIASELSLETDQRQAFCAASLTRISCVGRRRKCRPLTAGEGVPYSATKTAKLPKNQPHIFNIFGPNSNRFLATWQALKASNLRHFDASNTATPAPRDRSHNWPPATAGEFGDRRP